MWAEKESQKPKRDRQWNQQEWFRDGVLPAKLPVVTEEVEGFCGTTMCLAGKIVFDAGLVMTDTDGDPVLNTGELWKRYPQTCTAFPDFGEAAELIMGVPPNSFHDLWFTTMEGRSGKRAFRKVETVAQKLAEKLGETL
jgi:hypothetical protein